MAMYSLPTIQGDWVTPEHDDYAKAIARWAVNAERRAKAVAFVKDASDVAAVLKHVQEHKVPFAIRGGGHSAAGASSSEDGIVIDLSRYLAGAKVDPEAKLAFVGGGAVWGTVDSAAIQHGLATVGGTVNHTGVGGLVLGGGYGYLTGQHGLALDNLVQATLVTATGRILTVSETQNAELFWGIRGAGSNFGVVTEFVLKLHPQRRTVFAGAALYPGTALPQLSETLSKWYDNGLDEKEAILHSLTKGSDGKPLNLLIMFWNGPAEEGRKHFEDFFAIGPFLDLVQEVPYEVLNTLQNQGLPHGRNYYMKGVFISRPLAECNQKMMDTVIELTDQLEVSISFMFEYFPTKKVTSVPHDATCHIRGNRVNCVAFAAWDVGKEPRGNLRAAVGQLVDILAFAEKSLPAKKNTGYGNYFMEDPTNISSGSRASADLLFGDNYPRLKVLKQKYDPNQIFSKWCPIVL